MGWAAAKSPMMRDHCDLLELQLFFAQVNTETFCLVFLASKRILQDTGLPQPRSVTPQPGIVCAHEPLAALKAFVAVVTLLT